MKIECGFRCAIPTCREQEIDLAHIVPWAEVQRHEFSNLIGLCTPHHRQVDRGDIDRKAILQVKANLGVLSGRYTEFERRVIADLSEKPDIDLIALDQSLELLYRGLVQDGYLQPLPSAIERVNEFVDPQSDQVILAVPIGPQLLRVTPRGREFIRNWVTRNPI